MCWGGWGWEFDWIQKRDRVLCPYFTLKFEPITRCHQKLNRCQFCSHLLETFNFPWSIAELDPLNTCFHFFCSIFKAFYTQFRTVKNGYSVKLILFDLHTLMKIIQTFMSSKNVCYIIIWKLCE
jgi:hypothetical protein